MYALYLGTQKKLYVIIAQMTPYDVALILHISQEIISILYPSTQAKLDVVISQLHTIQHGSDPSYTTATHYLTRIFEILK